ncbi:hypothetical protein D3C71_666240 [compost metagenome]
MDFHSNLSIGADGVVLRNKHGLSGFSIKEPRNMSYLECVELYRRQLWRGVLRQDIEYGHRQKRSKAEFQQKLMKYARRAGHNYLTAFEDRSVLKDQDLLIGWAGKKLKAKMRELNRVHIGRKRQKIARKIFKNDLFYFTLRDTILDRKMVPVCEMIPEDLLIHELVQIILCRNGKKGTMQLLDAEGKWRTIQWQEMESATQADVLLAWAPLQVIKTWKESTQTNPRPLFRGPRLRERTTPFFCGTNIQPTEEKAE